MRNPLSTTVHILSKHAPGWHKPKAKRHKDKTRAAAVKRHGKGTAAQREEGRHDS